MMWWLAMGYDHESFWDQTPRTISLTFRAKTMQFEAEHNARAWLAWHIEALHRAKRLPRIEKLLMKQPQRIKQTWQEQLAVMDRWVAVTRRLEAARRQQ